MAIGRFQVAVGAIIQLKGTDEVLLIYRASGQFSGNIWEIPVGRLEQFESFEDGLRREVKEETGISNLKILQPFSVFSFMRGDKSAKNDTRGVIFVAETTQKEVRLSHEHTDYKWLAIDKAIDFVEHPGVKSELTAFRELHKAGSTNKNV